MLERFPLEKRFLDARNFYKLWAKILWLFYLYGNNFLNFKTINWPFTSLRSVTSRSVWYLAKFSLKNEELKLQLISQFWCSMYLVKAMNLYYSRQHSREEKGTDHGEEPPASFSPFRLSHFLCVKEVHKTQRRESYKCQMGFDSRPFNVLVKSSRRRLDMKFCFSFLSFPL